MGSLTLFTVDNEGVCRAGPPPPTYDYDYISNATVVGTLSDVSHVFFRPGGGPLYVVKDSELYSGPKPSDPSKNWFQGPGRRIGKAGWGEFKHLFFNYNGDLYAVSHDGELYAGPPPDNEDQSWLGTRGKKVGNGGWEVFYALFFDPQGKLHAVTADKFKKGTPPTSVTDNWWERSEVIGGGGWSDLSHFMSFTPDGDLWCVSKSDGKIYTARPPTSIDDNWIGRAQKRGIHYSFEFMAITQ